jgi:hypothetical protein
MCVMITSALLCTETERWREEQRLSSSGVFIGGFLGRLGMTSDLSDKKSKVDSHALSIDTCLISFRVKNQLQLNPLPFAVSAVLGPFLAVMIVDIMATSERALSRLHRWYIIPSLCCSILDCLADQSS